MQHTALTNILDATMRANPSYELVLFDRLPREQQEALRDLQNDPDFFGILRSRVQSGLGTKAVCHNTALLYLTLQQPGALPAYVRTLFGAQCNQAIAEMVLDGVLEIEWDGGFVSGAQAYELIYADAQRPAAQGALAELAIAALKYAQALAIDDVARLSARMYFYNRQPATLAWKRTFATPEAVVEHLGIQPGGPNAPLLERAWRSTALPASNDGWLSWGSRTATPRFQASDPTYKLYVSPRSEWVRDAFRATLEVLTAQRAPSFKIGKDLYGLLRPDKIVAYFGSFEQLADAADALRRALDGIPPHGVPFTADIAGDGLLSWGIDPPRDQQVLSWQGHESWRLWVTNRLATYLMMARTAPASAIEPWRFALERLRLEGIDTTTWTPAATIWREQRAVEG